MTAAPSGIYGSKVKVRLLISSEARTEAGEIDCFAPTLRHSSHKFRGSCESSEPT